MKWDRWPWTEAPAETRADSFTGVIEAALLAHAQRNSTADPAGLAVVIASSNYLGNVISESRVVTPAGDPRAAAITPAWLMSCGQRLVLRGEAVDWMVVRNGVAELIPSAEHEVTAGKLDRAAWQYKLTFDRPTREGGALSVQAGADATFHVRLGSHYLAGSAGLSGALRGSQTAAAAAYLERSIRDASAGPTGTLLPQPGAVGEEDSGKLRSEYAALAAQISKLGGNVALIESSRSGHDRPTAVSGNTRETNRARCEIRRQHGSDKRPVGIKHRGGAFDGTGSVGARVLRRPANAASCNGNTCRAWRGRSPVLSRQSFRGCLGADIRS